MSLDFLSLMLVLSFIVVCIWLQFHVLGSNKSWLKRSKKLPPGPYPWPIIGNLLQLGKNPHRSLAKLSKTYGPLMHLKLGTIHTIVVSSPEVAKEVLQKHDLVCSGRTVPHAAQALNHDKWSVSWSQIGTTWRKFRKICKEEMFSTSRLVSSERLHIDKVKQMRERITECCNNHHVVNIGGVVFVTLLNLMWNSFFSVDFESTESDSTQEMMQLVLGMMKAFGTPNVSDYFPLLKDFDPQGIRFEAEGYIRKVLSIFDEMMSQRLRSRDTSSNKMDLLEALIRINRDNDIELSHDDMKHFFLDLLLGGVDIATNTVEWAMTELLRNPKKLTKAKDELEVVIGYDKQVQESDIPRLSYLSAVIKETLRIHPPGPFLVPHKAESVVQINGYTIPKDANIIISVWAIGRDPRVWSDPEIFEPERFLESTIDYRGKDFELIPFSSGRRICPALPLAHLMMHTMLATLIHHFDWSIDDEVMRSRSLDASEKFGLSLRKAMPLMAYAATKC